MGNVIGGRRVYEAPVFCPPNLLLAGAMVHEFGNKSSQVATNECELELPLGIFTDSRRGYFEWQNSRSLLKT